MIKGNVKLLILARITKQPVVTGQMYVFPLNVAIVFKKDKILTVTNDLIV